MRTIKFRGKQFNDGKWVYGYLADGNLICTVSDTKFDAVEVKATTVGQFTGLHDKNGKEIYEGDIIQHRDVKLIVKFYRGAFGYSRTIKRLQESVFVPFVGSDDNKDALQFSDGTFFDTDYCEVVGNTHDNPELLEKGGKK